MNVASATTEYADPTSCFQDVNVSIPRNNMHLEASDIQKIIEDAIIEHRFQVYYQPIYSLSGNRFVSAEALIRLPTEEYGFIPPDIFIPIAEQTGIIDPIGDFVIEHVFQFMASEEYKRLGLQYMEINLSTTQCMVATLADHVIQLMNKYHISPKEVNFELTETASNFSQKILEQNLKRLSEQGVGFSLDDYGTGYSNIKRMLQFPLKIVKLDKLFADGLADGKLCLVLKSTVKMIKDINMEIVVEGIEDSKAFRLFKELGCDHVQGFYFCKPLPQERFVNFIECFNAI